MVGTLKNRLSISEAVRRVVLTHPSVLDCMRMRVINYSSLAKLIRDEVVKVGGFKDVSINAIKIGLIRFSDKLGNKSTLESHVIKLIARSTIELQTDLKVLTLRKEIPASKLSELIAKLSHARFFQLTQGTRTFTLAISKEAEKEVIDIVGREVIEDAIDDQSAIILVSPREIINVPGVIAYITSLLSWNGVNITQIISCNVDTILILSRRDVLKAYNIIEDLILRSRSYKQLLHI